MDKQAEAAAKFQSSVFSEMFVPKFIEKCAAKGITFETEEDLIAGLETAGMLKAAQEQMRAQGVDPTPSPKKAVRDLLKQAMFAEKPAEQGSLEGVKQAIAEMVSAQAEPAAPETKPAEAAKK